MAIKGNQWWWEKLKKYKNIDAEYLILKGYIKDKYKELVQARDNHVFFFNLQIGDYALEAMVTREIYNKYYKDLEKEKIFLCYVCFYAESNVRIAVHGVLNKDEFSLDKQHNNYFFNSLEELNIHPLSVRGK